MPKLTDIVDLKEQLPKDPGDVYWEPLDDEPKENFDYIQVQTTFVTVSLTKKKYPTQSDADNRFEELKVLRKLVLLEKFQTMTYFCYRCR